MATDSNRDNLPEDYIQKTIGQICQKLESSGDDCLFLRVTDEGTTCSKLGTKNALLFVQTQPQLVQEFSKFCSGIYSSLGVSVKRGDLEDDDALRTKTVLTAEIQADSEDGGRDEFTDDMGTCDQQTESSTNKPGDGMTHTGRRTRKDNRTATSGGRTESNKDRTAKDKRTASSSVKSVNTKKTTDINSRKRKSKLSKDEGLDEEYNTDDLSVNTATCRPDRIDSNEARTRPKRKMCTPSKLKLYETNFKKDSANSSIVKNVGENSTSVGKSAHVVKGKLNKSGQNKSRVEESRDRTIQGKGKDNLCKNNEQSEAPSGGNKTSRAPSGRNKLKSELNGTQTLSLEVQDGDVTDEDDIEEYDDDRDEDYVVESDESPSAKSFSNKDSPSNEKSTNVLKEKYSFKCRKCDSAFGYRGTLNRHIKNNVCSAVITRREAKKVKFSNQVNIENKVRRTDEDAIESKEGSCDFQCKHCDTSFKSGPSLKRHLEDSVCNTGVKKLKNKNDSKPGTDDDEKSEMHEDKRIFGGQSKRLVQCGLCGAFILRRGMNKHLTSKACRASSERKCPPAHDKKGVPGETSDQPPNMTSTETDSGELIILPSGKKCFIKGERSMINDEKSTNELELSIKEEQEDGDNIMTDAPTPATVSNRRRPKGVFPCSTCDFVFCSKATLKRHTMKGLCPGIKLKVKTSLMDGQEKLTCESCNKMFVSSIEFLRHRQRHLVSSSSGFTCAVCETDFMYDWERVRHMVRTHNVKGPLDCFVCLHSFCNYADYLSHKRFCKTTLKCEGETTSGNKENVIAGSQDNDNSNPPENDSGRVPQGEVTQKGDSDNKEESTSERPSVNVTVKLSCGTVISVKDSMIKSSYVADVDSMDVDKSHDVEAEGVSLNIPTHSGNSAGETQASSGDVEASKADTRTGPGEGSASSIISMISSEVTETSSVGTLGNSSIATASASVETAPVRDITSITCTRCHKDVRGLFTKDAGKHVCKICRRTYVNDFQLTKHMATHTASKFYSCHRCSKCFVETRYLQRHLMDTHHERYSVCRFCCALFSTREGLTQHLREKHPNQGSTSCRVCYKDFPEKIACIEHEDKHYRSRTRQYVCDICGKMLNNKTSLSQHMAWHQDLRPFICEVCNKGFRTRMNLIGHLPVHSGVKAYQCEICGQCFTLKETLRRHRRIHVKEKKYQCNKCGQKFRSTDGLNGHMVNSHLTVEDIGNLKFKVRQCKFCGKLCSSKQIYERHITTHTGERPFHCEYCPRSYSLQALLLRHIRTVHQRAEVHTCLLCHCQVSSRSKWRRHLRTRKHKERCEEMGLSVDTGPEGMVEGVHFKVSGVQKIQNVSRAQELTSEVAATQENVDLLEEISEEVHDQGFIQQITEEVHASEFIHQITGQVQNSDYIQQITDVVQDAEYSQQLTGGDENYIEEIAQEVETVPRERSTVMQIVYQDPSESETAVNSIVEGRTLQNIVYLKVLS